MELCVLRRRRHGSGPLREPLAIGQRSEKGQVPAVFEHYLEVVPPDRGFRPPRFLDQPFLTDRSDRAPGHLTGPGPSVDLDLDRPCQVWPDVT